MKSIVLGGGCFWCTEAVFQQVRGVEHVESGYAGGGVDAEPDYWSIHGGGSMEHAEVVSVAYDEAEVSLDALLDIFFATHNPTTPNQQGYDKGSEYRSIILCAEEELETAEQAKQRAQEFWDDPIVTEIKVLDKFTRAEENHQNYYNKNPSAGYCQVIIKPKLAKFRQKFSNYQKS